ncbi:hypothetical protein [Nocardioides sp.]|uniref:hypothetical protein n=1 Tax=Nocardioides sp. TaxID=35761 RepID=UPI0035172AAB
MGYPTFGEYGPDAGRSTLAVLPAAAATGPTGTVPLLPVPDVAPVPVGAGHVAVRHDTAALRIPLVPGDDVVLVHEGPAGREYRAGVVTRLWLLDADAAAGTAAGWAYEVAPGALLPPADAGQRLEDPAWRARPVSRDGARQGESIQSLLCLLAELRGAPLATS